VNWSASTYAASYNVYADGLAKIATSITALTYTDTGHGCCSNNLPTNTSAGAVDIGPTGIATPQLTFMGAESPVGFTTTITPGTHTANRTYSLPDASGTVCITTTCGGQFYQTLLNNSVAQPQEPAFDLIAGANMTITCVDSATVKTACTFISSSTAATAWASITSGTNSNAGTFTATGNSWDFSGATSFKAPTAGLIIPGASSGTVTLVGQSAAGTPTVTFGTSSGTPVVTASAPLAITAATGNITCATCVTSSGGGAISGTAPISVSAAGAVSISAATTGALGSIELTTNLGGTGAAPTVIATTITGATTNRIVKFDSGGNVVNSLASDSGTVYSIPEILDNTTFPYVQEVANEGVTGTTVNKWASLTGAPSTAIITTAAATGSVGIVAGGAGTTSNAQIAVLGRVNCVFDGGTTAGHFVTQSASVNGDCTDAGTSAPAGMPTAIVLSTNVGAGTYAVVILGGAGGSGSGSGTVNNCAVSTGAIAFYATSGTTVGCDTNIVVSTSTMTLGIAGTSTGTLNLTGSASGTVSVKAQNSAGTFNFNLPITAGTSTFLLTSAGGGSSPMTWTSPSITIDGQTCTLGSTCTTVTVDTNGTNNANQNLISFRTSTSNTIGLTVTPINTSGGQERFEVTGTTTPTGGGTGIAAPTAHSLLMAEGASNMNLVTSPSVNGNYICGFNVTASAAVDVTCNLLGVPVLTPSSGYTGSYSDRATVQMLSGGTTFTWNAPQITGNTAANFPVVFLNNNSGDLTFTANAVDKVNGSGTGGTYVTHANWATFMYQDSSAAPGNWWPLTIPQYAAFANTGANTAVTFNSTTGAFGTLANIVNCSPTRAGDIAYWNGSAYACLAGNNSGTQFLQETSSGVPSWNTVAGSGTVTSIATTSPITGGTITTTGTIACATCVTSAAALTNHAVVVGNALQATATISADTTTTHALFATGTDPAFRAIVAGDLPGSGVITINSTSCTVGSSCTITAATALNTITAAVGTNTLANGDNGQVWNWATTSSGNVGITFGETTASSSAGSPYTVEIKTLIGSTATPLKVDNSLNGSQTLPALSILPTWNTTGVVDAALFINVTNTASGTSSLLIDAKVGGVAQFKVDKAGNGTFTSGVTATTMTLSSGFFTLAETTAPSGSAGNDICYADSTAHAIECSYNNDTFKPATRTIASGTSALGTSSISSGACATVVTTSATGTLTTDIIDWVPNGSIKAVTGYVPSTSGGLSIMAYPTANNVNFDVCNWSSGSITPGAVTLNWRVVR